jgi:hypothetical protein
MLSPVSTENRASLILRKPNEKRPKYRDEKALKAGFDGSNSAAKNGTDRLKSR